MKKISLNDMQCIAGGGACTNMYLGLAGAVFGAATANPWALVIGAATYGNWYSACKSESGYWS